MYVEMVRKTTIIKYSVGYIYAKIIAIVYLKFKCNWVTSTLFAKYDNHTDLEKH